MVRFRLPLSVRASSSAVTVDLTADERWDHFYEGRGDRPTGHDDTVSELARRLCYCGLTRVFHVVPGCQMECSPVGSGQGVQRVCSVQRVTRRIWTECLTCYSTLRREEDSDWMQCVMDSYYTVPFRGSCPGERKRHSPVDSP